MENKVNKDLTIVVPLYNEEDLLDELYERLSITVSNLNLDVEVVLVNDGSKDNSLEKIKWICNSDSKFRFLSLSRNWGHQASILAGIDHAYGKAIVIIDGDLQDPPELIPALYEEYKKGFQVVYAKRKLREGESWFKLWTAKLFYRILRSITSIEIPLDTGDFRIISRRVAMHLVGLQERNQFIRGQIAWLGFKTSFIEYDREKRFKGTTKFSLRKMIKLAVDGITGFSNFPLRLATFLGFFFTVIAFLLILYALYSKYILDRVATGWTSLMVSTMLIGGIQLLCVGIIGEYLSRVGLDVKQRPNYIVEENSEDFGD